MNLQASGWAIRRRQLPKPSTTPLSVIHWWGEDQEESGGRGQYISRPNRRGYASAEVPGRCIGLGKLGHSNGSGRGRHVERGPVWSLCDRENDGNRKIDAGPRALAIDQSKSLAPSESFPILHVFHCHFASQDRKASPKKAGGAVNRKPSNIRARETGRPGPAVRDFGKIGFAQFWIRVLGVSRHGMRPKIGRAESLTA